MVQFWIIFGVVAPVVLAVLGYFAKRLIDRNDAAHERLWGEVKAVNVELGDLKVGQAEIKAQLRILIKNGEHNG